MAHSAHLAKHNEHMRRMHDAHKSIEHEMTHGNNSKHVLDRLHEQHGAEMRLAHKAMNEHRKATGQSHE